MTEADICDVAIAKLRQYGWVIACEVQSVDIVAQRDGEMLLIEAKKTLTPGHRHQLQTACVYGDMVMALVGQRPNADGMAWLSERGIGLWVLDQEIMAARKLRPSEWCRACIKAYADAIAVAFPNRRAGLPTGHETPAQDIQARVDAYRADHPSATWKEIHANVPSHYLTHKVMTSALRSNAKRLEWKALREAQR